MVNLNNDYYIYDDEGKYVHILPVNECLKSLEQRIIDQEGIIQAQKKMISEMDQNQHVDSKIEELQKQIDDLNDRLSNAFEISGRNWKKINKWQKEHDKQHGAYPTAGERYIYEFLPTGIITCVTCRCMLCNEEFDCYDD